MIDKYQSFWGLFQASDLQTVAEQGRPFCSHSHRTRFTPREDLDMSLGDLEAVLFLSCSPPHTHTSFGWAHCC